MLKEIEIKFIHGDCDKIASIEDIYELRDKMPKAGFIVLKGAGHIPFLRDDFKKVFDREDVI